MKKTFLVLSLILSPVLTIRAQETAFDPDPYTMIQNLQRVINESTNPRDIVEAERLIREVYGPAYQEKLWKNFKVGLQVAGFVTVGVVLLAVIAASK